MSVLSGARTCEPMETAQSVGDDTHEVPPHPPLPYPVPPPFPLPPTNVNAHRQLTRATTDEHLTR